ncbi:hypothetical protein B0G62_11567 [Paraburkholderia eburnea]|uniref:Uncharacterized protein n=1 Tax=Paraburkholderia eburnea TaxID=1189126 RepID=A0A2S4M0N1_9BURK|nr:hypothetical protein B0G62_11567 [Paraburkholderia eburnea]PRZ22232.1 hypothetical protein BX588_10771 [Paraburkholderia eburnea]
MRRRAGTDLTARRRTSFAMTRNCDYDSDYDSDNDCDFDNDYDRRAFWASVARSCAASLSSTPFTYL